VANPVIVIVIGGDNGNEVNTAKTKGQMGKKKECKKKKKYPYQFSRDISSHHYLKGCYPLTTTQNQSQKSQHQH
jgi:hypothetical protein